MHDWVASKQKPLILGLDSGFRKWACLERHDDLAPRNTHTHKILNEEKPKATLANRRKQKAATRETTMMTGCCTQNTATSRMSQHVCNHDCERLRVHPMGPCCYCRPKVIYVHTDVSDLFCSSCSRNDNVQEFVRACTGNISVPTPEGGMSTPQYR